MNYGTDGRATTDIRFALMTRGKGAFPDVAFVNVDPTCKQAALS
jgi:hypothetical protein